MRKLKFAFLFVLVLCLVAGVLTACDQAGGTTGTIPIPDDDSTVPGTSSTTLTGSEAWGMFIDSALNANAPTGNYVYADSTIKLGYTRDGNGNSYAFRVIANLDLVNDINSELLIELWRLSANGELEKMLVGTYYTESTLIYDCSGVRQGVSAVKTDNVNLSAIDKTLRELLGDNSLANFILDDLFSFDTGVVGQVGNLVGALFGESSLTTREDGSVHIEMPVSLASILGSALVGLLTPSDTNPIISYEIADIVNDLTGIDLKMMQAMQSTDIVLSADLSAEDENGDRLLTGIDFGIDLDFDTYGTELEKEYGIIRDSISLSVGASAIDKQEAPSFDIKGYLTDDKAAEGDLESAGGRGLDIASLKEYSPLTLDLKLSLGLTHSAINGLTLNDILGAFGTLFNGIITDSVKEQYGWLFDLPIDVGQGNHELYLQIRGGIDMFNADGTNLLIQLGGGESGPLATIGYIGAEESFYVDLSGMLGTGKFSIGGINLNKLLGGLIGELVTMASDALVDAGILTADGGIGTAEQTKELLESGEIVRYFSNSATEDEPIEDTIGLVIAIIESIDTDIDDLFNINEIRIDLSKKILDYIFGLVFTAESGLAGAEIPVDGASLVITNQGFALPKNINIGTALNLTNAEGDPFTLGVNVGITAQFGSVVDQADFDATVAALPEGSVIALDDLLKKDGKYIFLDENGNLLLDFTGVKLDTSALLNGVLASVGSVGIGLEAGININATEGALASLAYTDATSMMVSVLAQFAESFGVNATLELKAEVVDLAGFVSAVSVGANESVDIGALLGGINAYIAIKTADGTAPLELWLKSGVLYLHTADDFLGGLNLKVELSALIGAFSGSASEAVSVADPSEDGTADDAAFDIMGLLKVLLAKITIGDLYVDVDFAADFFYALLETLGVDMASSGISVTKPGTEEGVEISGGIKIELPSGLQIADTGEDAGLTIGIGLGLGDNFNLDLSLGGLNASVGGEGGYISDPEESGYEFVDFMASPFVALNLRLDLGAVLDVMNIDIPLSGENLSITIPEGLDIQLGLALRAKLDLRHVFDAFLGTDLAQGSANETELALELIANGDNLLAVYYKDNNVYVDAYQLLGARVQLEFNLIDTLLALLGGGAGGASEAVSAAGGGEDEISVFEFLLNITNTGFYLEAVDGLVDVINDALGTTLFNELSLFAELDLSQILVGLDSLSADEPEDEPEYFLNVGINADGNDIFVKLSGIGLGLGRTADYDAFEAVPTLVSDDFMSLGALKIMQKTVKTAFAADTAYYYFENDAYIQIAMATDAEGAVTVADADLAASLAADGASVYTLGTDNTYTEIGVLADATGYNAASIGVDTTAINLESVYVEVSGNITLGVEGGESDLEVGKWIGTVLPADANLSDTVRSFLQRLVLEIAAVEGAQSTRIDFEIKALLRFNPEDMADTGYLLSHSDISLNLLSEGTPLLAVAVIANPATGTSTIYVGSAEGGLISGGLAVPGINLGDLLASTEEDVTEQTEQAIDAVSAADDESVAAAGDDTTNIIGALLGAIGGIYMTDEELEVNLAANGLATLIGALLGVSVSPEEFAQLDPEKSYLSLLYPMRDGMLDLGIALSIGINPVNVGLSLGGLGVAINDSTKTIAPWVPEDETADSYYNNLTDLTGAGTVSFEATLGLEAKFGETSGLEGGVIPVGDIVSAFVTDLALELGLEIDDNLKVGLEAYIGGNFNFASAESIQLMIELRDMYDASNVVLGVYMDGSRIYVNLLGEKFVVENTGIANMIYDAVMGLMADEDDSATGSGEAVAATEGVDPAAEEMIAIVMEIASGRLGLKISERVLVAILSVVVGELAGADSAMTGEDLVAMFESLSLDAEISLDVNLGDEISLEVGVDTKYIGLGIAITNPNLTIGVNEAVANAVSAVVASGEYDSYSDSSYARFGLTLDVSYKADATFIKVTEQEAAKYNQSDRYDLVEGSYVQDSNGTYIRRGISFTEVLAVILENLLGDAGIETGTAILDEMLGALLEALGLDFYIDDIIEDNFRINLKGVLDLEALDLQYMLTNLAQRTDYLTEEEWNDKYTVDGKLTQALPATAYKLEGGKYVEIAAGEAYDGVRYYASVAGFDTMEILNALQAGIEIIFNPEISETVDIGIYLIEGEVYIDTSNIGGPKMMLDLFELLAMLDKMPAGGASEAVTAADEGSDSAIDINALLNALVSAIALRVANDQGTADENGYYNILSDGLALDVLLPSNLLGNLVSMIVGGEGYIFDDFVLAEGSRLSLVLGGGNGLAIQVEASTDTGFTFTVEAKAGLEIDFATTETDILTTSQRGSYTDVSAMVTNIVKLATGSTDGFESMGSQRIKFSVSGKAEFSSDGDASYDLGSLLANYIGDVAIYLSTDEAFSDGIGFRLSVAADIASLGLDKLTSLTALSDAVKEAENALAAGTGTQEAVDAANKALNDAIFAWLESTDYLAGLEIALELLELDAAGNLVTDIALGGIYISGGNLYLDGIELWDIVDNYSYVANFLQFVIDAAKLSTGTAAEAGAQSEAAIAASDSAERNALIELIYSNTEMQIVLTKGVISTLLGAVAGDFAAIADIFDSFEVSLGVEIGQNAYQQLYYLDQDGTTYKPLTTDTVPEGAKLYYRINGADGYEFVETTSNLRYNYYEGESYSATVDLSGAFVRIVDGDGNPIDTYLRRDNFVIYNETGIVTDLTEIADHSTLRVLYENVWYYLECSGDEGAKQLVTYDRLQGYVREANGTYVRLYSAHTRLDQFFIGLGVNVGSIDLGLAIGGLNLEFGSEKSLVPDYILEGKSKHPVAYNEMLGKAYTYENGVYTPVDDPDAEGFDGSAEIYYYDVPLTPFYDSVVTVGMSVEFELAITEGEVNLGEMLGGLVGDLDGVVVDIPATGKGYSSAHLRLDLTLIIDMQDLPSSQIAIELYNLSSEAGAEIKWLGAYYLNETVYLDLSFFGLPKIAVPMTEIADMLRDLIDDLVEGTGIYDDIEVPSAGEAITADGQDEAALGEDEFEERVAQLLISNRTLQIAVGNAFMRYLLENITLGDVSLSDFVYEQLEGSLDITLDLSDFLDIGIGAELSLKGDRYEPVVSVAAVTGERPEYVFVEAEDSATMPEEGWFTPDGDNFREMGTTDVAEGLPKYVRHEVKSRGEGNDVIYYTYTPLYTATDGDTYRFDAADDRYVLADEGYTGTLYTRTEVTDDNIAAYSYKAGASANPNDYDTVLTLDVGVGNIDLYFTEQRDPIVPVDELKQYNHFNSADTVSLSETISLDLLFSDNAIVGEDIAGLLTELFPDSSYDINAILEVLGDDGDVLRNIDLTISLEFKLGAFLNYLRSLDALYGLAYGDLRDQLLDLEGDIDLITFVNAIQAVIGAKVPDENGNIYYDDAPDDLVGLETFLYFINASVVISVSGDENPVHDMLGVYLYLGEGTLATAENSDGKQIYSNFYATTYGDYYFDGSENEYKPIIDGNYTQGETKYSKDSSFLYPDNNLVPGSSQAYIRDEAGLYADLTYLGQPGVFVQLEELRTFLSENMGTDPSASSGASEAIAADGGDGTEGTSSLLPIDLGSILGDVNISDSLPLLSGEIASYITAFVYGIRITSTYIKVLLNVDFMTQLLSLLGIEAEFNDFEQSSLTINVDPNNYVYAPVALIEGKTEIFDKVTELGIGQATTEQINFTNNRFSLIPDEDGMYFVTSEGYFALRSDMTANDLNGYNRGYYNIETVETYIHIEEDDRYILTSEASRTDLLRAETYAEGDGVAVNLHGTYAMYVTDESSPNGYRMLIENDYANIYVVYATGTRKAFIEAEIFLWNHSVTLGINLPATGAAEYTYSEAEGGEYKKVDRVAYIQSQPDGLLATDETYYLYYRGGYERITDDNLYRHDGSGYAESDLKTFLNGFNANPEGWYLLVTRASEGFSAYVGIEKGKIYSAENVGAYYEYVGAGKGGYNRDTTTSLISYPEFYVHYYENEGKGSAYVDSNQPTYILDANGNLVEVTDGEVTDGTTRQFSYDEVHFVATENGFVSVAEYKEAYGEDAPITNVYSADYIDYLDAGDLYAINLTIRGAISLGQYVEYLTKEEWESRFDTSPGDDVARYSIKNGKYVQDDEGIYYAYASSSEALRNILGAVVGDMDALFTVENGYKAQLPFEIRATVMIDYPAANIWTPYIAGMELAIDVWRTEASDDTLTHVLGLYYMSDIYNIGDNDDSNDAINESALYLDLSWIFGDGAKFKIDLTDYPLEALLNDTGIMGSIFGEGSGQSEAVAATEADQSVKNPDNATVAINVFTRSLVLQASAGFIKLVVGLIAPNTADMLEQYLPNLSIKVELDTAPYDLTIGAVLYDETGDNGLLELGITLNLFNPIEPSDGLQISFDSIDDYKRISAERLESLSKDYTFYYGLFSRVANDDIVTDGTVTYYRKDRSGAKGYVPIDIGELETVKAGDEMVYVANNEKNYAPISNSGNLLSPQTPPAEVRYALIPAGYVQLTDAADYALAIKNGFPRYFYNYRTGQMVPTNGEHPTVYGDEFYPYADGVGETGGTAKLYIRADMGSAESETFVGIAKKNYEALEGIVWSGNDDALKAWIDSAKYMPDGNGTYVQKNALYDYTTLLDLDLGQIISFKDGELVADTENILDVLIGALENSGLETVQIGGSLSIDLAFSDIINWTRQMTELMKVEETGDTFALALASLALNSAEFVSSIGTTISLAVQVNIGALMPMLPGLVSGETSVDINTLLPALLAGAQIYLKISYNTNFHGEDIKDAKPLEVWVEVDDALNANIYLDTTGLGAVLGIEDTTADGYGQFFGKLKLEGLLNIGDLLASAGGAGAGEAIAAADTGLIIDIKEANTGLLTEDIWGIMNLLLGQALLAGDMLSVGLNEAILSGLIGALMPEFPEDQLQYLPTFKITSGSDTSGVNILVGGGPSVQIQLAFNGGSDDFATVDEAVSYLNGITVDGDPVYSTVYGIASEEALRTYLADIEKNNDEELVLSTKKYGLVIATATEEAWLGDRYELTGFDAEGNPVFSEEPLLYEKSYGNAFSTDSKGTSGVKYLQITEDIAAELAAYTYESADSSLTYEVNHYMLVSTYERVTGKTYSGTVYYFNESAVVGEYLELGDLTLAIELGDLSLGFNREFSDGLTEEEKGDYTDLLKGGELRLNTSIDVGFHGVTGADIELGALVDLIFGIDAIKTALGVDLVNNSLAVDIIGDLGNASGPYFEIVLDAYIKLGGKGSIPIADMQIGLTVNRYNYNSDGEQTGTTPVLKVYFFDNTLYADLYGLLGEGMQVKLEGLDLLDLIAGAASEGAAEAVATTMEAAENMTLHDYAYLGALINPGYFSLQLTLSAVQAILAKVGAENASIEDTLAGIELPDIGDIQIAANGIHGPKFSLNAKLSDNFAASLDVNEFNLGNLPVKTKELVGELKDYTCIANIANRQLGDFTLSASANIDLTMTSEGLKPGDDDYDDSLAGWVIGLITDALGATSVFVQPLAMNGATVTDSEYIEYGGPVYTLKADGTYEEIGTIASATQYVDLDGVTQSFVAGTAYYRTTIVEAVFADNDVNLSIGLEADLNLGAFMLYGIGGLLLSDLKVSIELGYPFNSTLLELYLLGSSRLSEAANNNIYILKSEVESDEIGAYNDAAYINAEGLGLGKIKFQGITSLFGANIGQIYDEQTSAAAIAEATSTADGDTTDATGGGISQSVSIGLQISEGFLGLTIDKALIGTVFGLLDLDFELPDVQKISLGLSIGDEGLSELAIGATVDKAGTGINLALNNLDFGFERKLDVNSLVNEVATEFGGLTYSSTAGTMTLVSTLLDSLDISLGINVDKRGTSIVQGTNTVGWDAVDTTQNSTVTLTGSGEYVKSIGSYSINGYMLKLHAIAKHPHIHDNDQISLDVFLGNGEIYLDNIALNVTGLDWLVQAIAGGRPLSSLVSALDGLFDFAYTDYDTSTWDSSNPVATTAEDGTDAANNASASTASEVTDHTITWGSDMEDGLVYKTEGHYDRKTYKSIELSNLINKVSVNLFTAEGYQPYLTKSYSGTGGPTDASLISVKVEFTKDGYNELMLFLYCTLLGLLQTNVDTNANHIAYFALNDDTNLIRHGVYNKTTFGIITTGEWHTYQISNLFRELDYIDTLQGTDHEKTAKKVELLRPYAESLPYALIAWLMQDMAGIDLNWITAVANALGNLTLLIGTILPPFANYDSSPNPSLNLYIDLAPESSKYGLKQEIAPGIQAIELMVNGASVGDATNGKLMTGIIDSKGELGTGSVYYDGSEGTLRDVYILSINPKNLTNGSGDLTNNGEGVATFLEADSLVGTLNTTSGQPSGQPLLNGEGKSNLSIVVDNPATKSATMYAGRTYNSNGTVSNSGTIVGNANETLNGQFIVDRLPLQATVQLLDPSCQHSVDIVWDAGAVDLTAATGNDRLAGYLYGYALNLVVAKIPVYVTDDYAYSSIENINISLTDQGKLPDEIQITFKGDTTEVSERFGTALYDGEGAMRLAALRNPENTSQYLFRKETFNADGVATGTTYEWAAINVAGSDTVTYTLQLYPAYAGRVEYKADGSLETVSSADGSAEYCVIKASNSTISVATSFLPVGTIAWDLGNVTYDWDGGTVEIGFTYQWGYAEAAYQTVEIDVESAAIVPVQLGTAIISTTSEGVYVLETDWSTYSGLIDNIGATLIGSEGSHTVHAVDSSKAPEEVGDGFTADIVFYVGDFRILRNYSYDDTAKTYSLESGFMGNVAVHRAADDKWLYDHSNEMHAAIAEQIAKNGYATVAQPVTIRFVVTPDVTDNQSGGTPEVPAGGDNVAPASAKSLMFSDGTKAVENDGELTYEISTAAQLYGAMPTVGTVVSASGKKSNATFDWNGFVYDGDSSANTAVVTVQSAAGRSVEDVSVTVESGSEAAGVLDIANATAGYITKIVEARYRGMAIDPYKYGTLEQYLKASGFGETVNVYTTDSPAAAVQATVVSWNNSIADSNGNFSDSVSLPLAGASYPYNEAVFDIGGKLYKVVVPIVVIARAVEVVDIDLRFDGFKEVYSYNRFGSEVRRYVGGSQVIEVTYSREELIPTAINIMNIYDYAADNPFVRVGDDLSVDVVFTFADGGGEQAYSMIINKVLGTVDGNEDDPKAYIDGTIRTPVSASSSESTFYRYDITSSNGATIQSARKLEVTFSAVRITAGTMSSPVAYGDLDGIAAGSYTEFAPYDGMTKDEKSLPTLKKSDGSEGTYTHEGDITYYIGGTYIPVETLDAYAEQGYTLYDRAKFVKGSGNSYQVSEDGTYYFVYLAVGTIDDDTAELTFDHSSLSYDYNGGQRRTVLNIVTEEGITGSVTFPVYIVSGKVAKVAGVSFAPDDFGASTQWTVTDENGIETVYTDKQDPSYLKADGTGPYLAFDPFDAVSITRMLQTGVGEDGNATYTDSVNYKYLPSSATIITASGAEMHVAVTWTGINARNTYAGGDYSARMIIAGPTLTTSATQAGADDTVTSLFGNQGFTFDSFIRVRSRSVYDEGVIVTVNGGNPDSTNEMLPNADGTATGGGKYINPYEFELADFQAATTANSVEVKFADDTVTYTYTTTDTDYKLAWDFSTMAVDYLGGKVALTARLTGPDGSTQTYEIPYLVQRMLVAEMTSYKGVNNPTVSEEDGTVTGGDNYFTSSFGVDVNDTKALGVAETSFKINPFNPLSQSLPTGYHVTFNVYNPNLDENGEFTGEFTGAPSITVDYSYLKFTMPSSAKITAEKAQKTDNAGYASVQLGSGQRIRIPLVINGKVTSARPGAPAAGGVLTTSVDGVTVVWHGTRTIEYNAGYDEATNTVTFTQAVMPPTQTGRTVTYTLTAYIGAVVDAAGNVIDWAEDGTPACQSKGITIKIAYTPVSTTPEISTV